MVDKTIKTAIEQDINEKDISLMRQDNNSDLIQAMKLLHSDENIESNTILQQEQVNGIVMMDWAGKTYHIPFLINYAERYVKYVISGYDGRGRKEIIQIAEAIQRDKMERENKFMELLGKR